MGMCTDVSFFPGSERKWPELGPAVTADLTTAENSQVHAAVTGRIFIIHFVLRVCVCVCIHMHYICACALDCVCE